MRGFTIALAALIVSCGQPKDQKAEQPAEKEAKKQYIPVTDYIRNEIKTVDSLPVGILKRENPTQGPDSIFIQPQEFDALAAEFISKELEEGNFEKSFTESSFFDQTTESLVFTYQATDPATTIRRVDVLASPSLELDKIKSIYIEKVYKNNDTAISKKMYWKANTSFLIVTAKTLGQQAPLVHQVKVIWDPTNY